MNLNIKIRNIGFEDISNMDLRCCNCNYWFACSRIGIVKELKKSPKFFDFLRAKLIEIKSKNNCGIAFKTFFNNGGKVKIAYIDKSTVKGIVVYGSYYLFPKLKEFNVYPPDYNSIFIACMFIDPVYQDFGIGERLLLSVEKDSLESGILSIESIAKKQNEDITDEEYENLHLMPLKFLIKNGFLIKKNDEYFPLLRLDLTTIETVLSMEEYLFAKLFAKKEISRSAMIKMKTADDQSANKPKR